MPPDAYVANSVIFYSPIVDAYFDPLAKRKQPESEYPCKNIRLVDYALDFSM